MDKITEYIESGVLELYVMGIAGDEEARQVEQMAARYPRVQHEIEEIRKTLESVVTSNAVTPDPTIKPFLLATIDYTERLAAGEAPSFPPELHENSVIGDYSEWLDREDMALPPDFDQFHAKIIGYTSRSITAVIWIKTMAPLEVHDKEYEKFLILEGTCDIVIDGKARSFVPGDYMSIPLHANHYVKVTSAVPCKAILQRIAA